ncbi:MAG: hypothetical protein E6970_01845 [Peptostreptococcus sp.]|uniref:hypothetical protein n=1 Tax=Peptostreptococcus sp. TaxID=1262 RepID=UPI0029015A9F|nr:hypothetical protein [Peptostreptococcus sp.]MDU1264548.1 hypothetical protein [Peptostreptococcus sp.]
MTAKQWLQRVFLINKEIRSLYEELEELNAIAEGGAIEYKERVQTSGNTSREDVMCKIADLKDGINTMIMGKLEIITEISLKIASIDDIEIEPVLRRRYILCQPWEKIAVELSYSIRKVYDLHGKGLKKIEQLL